MQRSFQILIVLVFSIVLSGPARAIETSATAAYVYDQTTGTVLLEKRADIPLPPASMSKLMTLNMLFEALKDGRVTMETRFGVSTRAREMGGSTMFLNEQDRPTVKELIQGVIVQSGNDACVVIAEGLAGSEEAFARLMNERAIALGMKNSTFANSSGWPDPNQRMSMRDLGILATRFIEEFPEYYGFFSQKEFGFDGRAPDNRFNRNPLLKLNIGADGLKTGFTDEAGYGLVGSAVQGGRRVVVVITGLKTAAERADEAERLINWAFRQFVQKTVIAKGTEVARADVWMGDQPSLGLIAPEDMSLLLPSLNQGALEAEIRYRSPLEAPILEGQEVANLVIRLDGLPDAEFPLVADRAVAKGGFVPKIKTAAGIMFGKLSEQVQGMF